MSYKGYLINNDKLFPTLYSVTTEGRGGKIPSVLEGRFTSVAYVRELIDHYLAAKEETSGRKATTKE